MECSEVLRRRRTLRHDTDEPPSPEAVERVLDGSSQGWASLVLTGPADRARSWPDVPQTPTLVMPQDPAGVQERRRRQDVVHRGQR